MIVTYPDKRKQATSKLKKISNRFALQLQQQLEVPLKEIEKAIEKFGTNHQAVLQYFEKSFIHELQWRSFAWHRFWTGF